MHVALIIDSQRLSEERATLDRLVGGLIGQGLRCTVLSPGAGPEEIALAPGATWIEARLHTAPWMRPWRRHEIVSALEPDPPAVIHAMGEDSFAAAVDAAARLECPLTVEVWSAQQLRRLPLARGGARIAGYLARTTPLAESLRQRVDPELVSLVPVGTVVPRSPPPVLRNPAEAVAIAVVGSGRDLPAYRSMLAGLSALVRDHAQVQACMELRGPHDHEIWRWARRLELLGHLSAVQDAAQHRALLTGCDILVMPERYGEARPLVYQAMAHGMAIVACADPYVDVLIDDRTALLIEGSEPPEWTRRLRRLLGEPALARRLGSEARELVRARNRLEGEVEALATALSQVVSGGAHSFART